MNKATKAQLVNAALLVLLAPLVLLVLLVTPALLVLLDRAVRRVTPERQAHPAFRANLERLEPTERPATPDPSERPGHPDLRVIRDHKDPAGFLALLALPDHKEKPVLPDHLAPRARRENRAPRAIRDPWDR